MNLAEILTLNEGKTLEFKLNLDSKDRILRSLVAFANTAGGTLIVGISDGTKKVVGLKDPLTAELQISHLIADNIAPRLIPDIQVKLEKGRYILIVEIARSSSAPHHLKREGSRRGVYIRIGSTNRPADEQIISELRRSLAHQAYDETPLPDNTVEDIDIAAIIEDFKGIRSIKMKDLETLGILVKHQRALVPTIGGLLLYGRARLNKFPDAWIQAGVFSGKDRSIVIDSTEITTYIPRAITEVLAFIKRNLAHSIHIGEVKRTDSYQIPLAAIREAVINAIVHADYSQRGAPIRIALYVDRLEIDNPGLLPFGMTVEEIQLGVSRIRNRVLARVCKDLNLIEQWGSGIQRINSLCKGARLKAPHYEEISTHFRVILSKQKTESQEDTATKLDPTKTRILEILRKYGPHSTNALAKRIRLSTRTVRHHLGGLKEQGVIEERGSGPRDPHKVYAVAPK